MNRSTPKLSEAARHLVVPDGIVRTTYPRIKRRLALMGISYDPWQGQACRIALGLRENGRYAATVGGNVWSIPRQIGKTFTVGSLMIAMCIEYPGLLVVWTSHHLRTTTTTFRAMQAMVRRKGVASHLLRTSHSDGIRSANGEQEIAFNNGSMIMFGARAEGFGRGIPKVDVIVFDEAQILDEKALDDMIATTMQARHEHGALLFYIGTPPRPVDDGEAFANKRRRALSGKTTDQMYLEFGADPGCDPDDQAQWRKANPSFPSRTPLESMLRLRENLPSLESWLREGLGVWDEEEVEDAGPSPAFESPVWTACFGEIPMDYEVGSVGVATSFGGRQSAIVLGARSGDRVLGLPAQHGDGTSWVVTAAVELAVEHRVPIVLDKGGPAGFLLHELEKQARAKGVRVRGLTFAQAADAAALLDQYVESGRLLHGCDGSADGGPWELLQRSVESATRRASGDRWLWGRKPAKKGDAAPDITPLEATTVALWGLGNGPARSRVESNLEAGRPAVMTI